MQIRPYRDEDLQALVELMADLGYKASAEQMKHRMEQMAHTPYQDTYMAVINGEVVGMFYCNRLPVHEELVISIDREESECRK